MIARTICPEPIIEPDLPIIDPHHHLWLLTPAALEIVRQRIQSHESLGHVRLANPRYLFEELLADVQSGHNVRATVLVEAHSMYRKDGPEHLRSVGEVEFANGVAAMAASGDFGDVKLCAGIVGHTDLRGDRVEEVLEAHIAAGNGRYRGVRQMAAHSSDPVLARDGMVMPPNLLADPKFRNGVNLLGKFGLSFDICMAEPQLPEAIDLARAVPDVTMILDHIGIPLGIGGYKGKREERFPIWRDNMRALAKSENVYVKLGGLALPTTGTRWFRSDPPATSAQLADEWRPYIETCVEAFGADRCMFESDFPVESGCCTYPIMWNAFKRTVSGASKNEKLALFNSTAANAYRLTL